MHIWQSFIDKHLSRYNSLQSKIFKQKFQSILDPRIVEVYFDFENVLLVRPKFKNLVWKDRFFRFLTVKMVLKILSGIIYVISIQMRSIWCICWFVEQSF